MSEGPFRANHLNPSMPPIPKRDPLILALEAKFKTETFSKKQAKAMARNMKRKDNRRKGHTDRVEAGNFELVGRRKKQADRYAAYQEFMKNLDAEIRVAEEFESMIVKNIQLRRRMIEKEQMEIKIKEAKEKEKQAAEASEAKKIKVEKLDREFQRQYEFTLLQPSKMELLREKSNKRAEDYEQSYGEFSFIQEPKLGESSRPRNSPPHKATEIINEEGQIQEMEDEIPVEIIEEFEYEEPVYVPNEEIKQALAQSLSRLIPGQWLDSVIIDFYLTKLEKEHNLSFGSTKIICMDSTLLPRIESKALSYDRKDRSFGKMFRTIDFNDVDLILVPVCKDFHWVLYAFNLKKREAKCFDSLGFDAIGKNFSDMIASCIEKYASKGKDKINGIASFSFDKPKNIPGQENASGCGVFVCAYASILSQDLSLLSSEVDEVAWRGLILKDIQQVFWRENIKNSIVSKK